MKKLIALAAFIFAAGLSVNALAQGVLEGTYANDAGTVTIAKAPQGSGDNYDVTIADKSGKCNVKIAAATNQVTATGKNGAVYNLKVIAAVESQTYPNFSLWPQDETISLAKDALPFDKLDPACQAFKGDMVFTRTK